MFVLALTEMMLFYWSAQECWRYLASDWNWIELMNSKWSKMDWTWIDEHETLTRKSFPIYGVSCEDEFELEMLRLHRKNKTLEHLFHAPSGNEFAGWKSSWTAPGIHDMSSWIEISLVQETFEPIKSTYSILTSSSPFLDFPSSLSSTSAAFSSSGTMTSSAITKLLSSGRAIVEISAKSSSSLNESSSSRLSTKRENVVQHFG